MKPRAQPCGSLWTTPKTGWLGCLRPTCSCVPCGACSSPALRPLPASWPLPRPPGVLPPLPRPGWGLLAVIGTMRTLRPPRPPGEEPCKREQQADPDVLCTVGKVPSCIVSCQRQPILAHGAGQGHCKLSPLNGCNRRTDSESLWCRQASCRSHH